MSNPVEEPLDPIPIEEAAKADRIASTWPEAVIRCRWCEMAFIGQNRRSCVRNDRQLLGKCSWRQLGKSVRLEL